MKGFFVLFAVAILLFVPSGFGSHFGANIRAGNYPTLTVTNSDNVTMNLSLYAVAISSPYLPVYFVNILSTDTWNVSRTSNDGVSYFADISLIPSMNLPNFSYPFNDSFLSPVKLMNVTLKMYVNLTKFSGELPSVYIYNKTSPANNYTLTDIDNHTLEITVTIIESHNFRMPLNVLLFQKASGISRRNVQIPYLGFNASNMKNQHSKWGGIAFSTDHLLTNSTDLYWWYNNYTINGVNETLNSFVLLHGSPYVVFVFTDRTGSAFKIVQDPFLTVPSSDFSKVPIISQPLQEIYHYILDNSIYSVAGVIVGLSLIMVTYVSYRRRKI